MKTVFVALLASVAMTQVSYANDGSTQIAKIGDWRIMQTKDAMTDRPSCLAYWGATDVQMSTGSLYIPGIRWVTGYWIRFDDQPPVGEVPITQDERLMGGVLIEGLQFAPLRNAHRVRVREVVDGGSADYDFDMTDGPRARQFMDGPQCS